MKELDSPDKVIKLLQDNSVKVIDTIKEIIEEPI